MQGGHHYTMTLTDVATGWTKCLPLLNRGREAVRAALQVTAIVKHTAL